MGSFIAMDAEQKRDADGKFGSGGGSSGGGSSNSFDVRSVQHGDRLTFQHGGQKLEGKLMNANGEKLIIRKDDGGDVSVARSDVTGHAKKPGMGPTKGPKASAAYRSNLANDSDIDTTYNMSGEKGREARKLARDCMTGRFRQ